MAKDDRKARRRRPRNGFLEIANGLFAVGVILVVVAVGAFFYGLMRYNAPGPSAAETTFLVEEGNSLATIATRLAEQGIVDDGTFFRYASMAVDRTPRILPGEYAVPAGASMKEVFEVITSGKPRAHFVMVNPGQSAYEVMMLLNDPSERLTGDPVAKPAEGSVLPVRHDYLPGEDRAALLKKMTEAMDARVEKHWQICVTNRSDVCGPGAPLETKEDFVILASIVEKETGIATERPIVASLFINRLRRGMRLQTDPTILYGIYEGVPQASLTITRSQKARETRYNTYIITGLPPTPITNPGEAALEAVANPADTDYLYMMAVTPGDYSDGHYFASTRQEHDQNVAKYRAQEREQKAAEADAAEGDATAQ